MVEDDGGSEAPAGVVKKSTELGEQLGVGRRQLGGAQRLFNEEGFMTQTDMAHIAGFACIMRRPGKPMGALSPGEVPAARRSWSSWTRASRFSKEYFVESMGSRNSTRIVPGWMLQLAFFHDAMGIGTSDRDNGHAGLDGHDRSSLLEMLKAAIGAARAFGINQKGLAVRRASMACSTLSMADSRL